MRFLDYFCGYLFETNKLHRGQLPVTIFNSLFKFLEVERALLAPSENDHNYLCPEYHTRCSHAVF